MKKKNIIAGLIIIAFILLVVSVIFYANSMHTLRQLDPLELESMQKEQIIQEIYKRQSSTPMFYFIPIFGFFGLVVGALVYYVVSGDVEKKDKIIVHNTDVILQLLDTDERKVIKKIVENSGKIQQVEITYMEGFTKVKSHRIVGSLIQKGILEKEQLGKMRLIRMNKDLYEILKTKELK